MAITPRMKAWLELLNELGTVYGLDVSSMTGEELMLDIPDHPLNGSTAFDMRTAQTLDTLGYVEVAFYRGDTWRFTITREGIEFVRNSYQELGGADAMNHRIVFHNYGSVGVQAAGFQARASN